MTYTIKTLNEKIAEIERDLSAYKMNFSDGAMGPGYEMKGQISELKTAVKVLEAFAAVCKQIESNN